MEFIRIESVQGDRIFAVVEISREEYTRIINQNIERAERDRQNEADRAIERQWEQPEIDNNEFVANQYGDFQDD